MAQPMLKLDVRSNTRQIVAELKAERANIPKAQARAINRTLENLRTEAGREIRKEYAVTLRGIRQASKIVRSSPRSKFPRGELSFSGRPINLAEFGARVQNPWNVAGRKRRNKGGGVTVKVKVRGGRKLVEGAFIAVLKSGQNAGKKGVFRRTGEGRYPIKFLPSLSVPQMTEQRAIAGALLKFSDVRYEVNLRQQLAYLTRPGSR